MLAFLFMGWQLFLTTLSAPAIIVVNENVLFWLIQLTLSGVQVGVEVDVRSGKMLRCWHQVGKSH